MCDPRWIYGLSIEIKSMVDYARINAPECVCEEDDSLTSILVVEKFEHHFGQILYTELGVDIFDEKFEPKLVLVLHEEYLGSSKLTVADENFLCQELGMEEKGKWYRCYVSFHPSGLEHYKKTIPGEVSSKDKLKVADSDSSNFSQLSRPFASAKL